MPRVLAALLDIEEVSQEPAKAPIETGSSSPGSRSTRARAGSARRRSSARGSGSRIPSRDAREGSRSSSSDLIGVNSGQLS